MRKPYIGVTGYTDREQVQEVLRVFPELTGKTMGDWEQLPVWHMAGVLVSSKTMRGGTNRWPGRYPNIESVPGIFPHDERVLGLIHFNTDEEDVASELKYLFEKLNYPLNIDGVQLNVAWPEPKMVRKFWHEYYARTEREPYVVLQIGEDAFSMIDHNPSALAKWLWPYEGVIDYVLLDPSGGAGREFDPFQLLPYIKEVEYSGTGIGVGVAGGLSDICTTHLGPILEEHPRTSIDAEGRLMNSSDRLDTVRAVKYAKKMVNRYLATVEQAEAV